MTGDEFAEWIESIAEAVENAPLGHENRKRIFAKAIAELSAKERQRLGERLIWLKWRRAWSGCWRSLTNDLARMRVLLAAIRTPANLP